MRASVAVAKEADRKQEFSPTTTVIHRVRDEPERRLGSLGGVIGDIRSNGGTPSVESIATQLSGMHSTERAPVLSALQQTHGNRYVQRMVAGIQAKLKVGQPGDKYEQEADRVADEVMRMPEPGVQRQPGEKEEELQAKDLPSQTTEVTPNMESRINAIKGVGQPLPVSSRAFFEPRFGYDFSQVQAHTDAEADNLNRTLNARAFTTGQDIFFRQGEYNPGSSSDRKLLAHELTHVVQQMSGARPKLTLAQPGDRYEQEAGQVARAVIHREQRATIEKADEGLVRRQVKEEQEPIQTKAEGLRFQRQAEEEDPKKQVARGAPVGRKDSSNSDRKSVKQSKSTSSILHLQQKIGNQSVQRLLESKAQNDDMISGMVQLNAPIMMAFWRQRTRGGEQERTGVVESREDTEAMLQREITHLRPRIPAWYNIPGMGTFDSQFFVRGSDLFDFRGHVMRGWEVNYYFISMAMAHQGYSWSQTQDRIVLWNTIQDIPLMPGEGTMTDEMWFAAQQGFDDEIDRLPPRSEPAEPIPPGATPFTCFPGDVPITLGDGSEILISTLRPGQYVLAADMTNTIRKCKVTDVHIHSPGQVLILQFTDGRILKVTANHLVYSSGQWVEASELSPGDSVSSLTFDHCGITSLILENVINRPFETETLYDITVDNCHTFFAQGILVHNKI